MESTEMTSDVLQRVHSAMREPIRDFIQLVRELMTDDAKAVNLFSDVVSADFNPKVQIARSVLVVDRVELPMLRRLAGYAARFGKASIAAPLIMTPKYIGASLDSFPLEIMEIVQQNVTVFGKDYFGGLTLEDAHVRLQCEREMKRALIGLRQGLLATAGREKHVASLEREAVEPLLRTLRGLLWLRGLQQLVPANRVVAETERIADRRLPGLGFALSPNRGHRWQDFDALYADVEALMEIVDAW